MSIRNLQPLLRPRSLALIGASGRPGSLGATVLANVRAAGFAGPIAVVNPHRVGVPGTRWVASVAELSTVPELAIVMTPAAAIPGIIAELGALGTRCAVVLSAGITQDSALKQRMLDAAKPHLLRIVGPNCLGIMAPHAGLDATFARTTARPGRLALISQSGALVTAILDWADARGIGFSGVVSVGDMADVDVGDMVDLFAVDPQTDAILLYLEGLTDAAKFMSAARAAVLNKPVIAIKAGRSPAAAAATLSHSGALAGSYDVYRAAFDRVGIVTVDALSELFDAAEILSCYRGCPRGRLAIVTNGGGAGILAVDALRETRAELATLSAATIAKLDTCLPPGWSHADPVDIVGDAAPSRYRDTIGPVLRDDGVDALLVMNCPTAMASAEDFAQAIAEAVKGARTEGVSKPVIGCWLGDSNRAAARGILSEAKIPLFATPQEAVRGFGYLLDATRARSRLLDAPTRRRDIRADFGKARALLTAVRREKRTLLTEIEAKELLAAYGIAVAPTRFAAAPEVMPDAVDGLAPPYAVKVVSPDISHKSDVGGVALGLPNRKAAAAAACAMETRIRAQMPGARIEGFAVETMIERPHSHQLIAGIATDPVFGRLLVFGAGGTAVEILADKVLALPPLDDVEAHAMIAATRISKLLAGYRNEPRANVEAVAAAIDALAAMVVDLPDITELDINPLLADPAGVIALDARVRLGDQPLAIAPLAIRPPPMAWSADLVTRSGFAFHVRPVRSDDEPLLAEFFTRVSPEDLRFRFLNGLGRIDHERLATMVRVDYRRTISFLAFEPDGRTVIATAMLAADPDRTRAEVALVTRADMKGRGLSWNLFEHVLRYAEAERIGLVEALEFADHDAALRMEREMGFTCHADPDDPTLRILRRTFEAVAPGASA
ncbi:bifunctional acetate--CoA ligase family protein/GNAT family N-acetyltransferase [Sphingopyxis chilensis]